MVKVLNCYLYAKKVMALCLRVQFFWPTLYNERSAFKWPCIAICSVVHRDISIDFEQIIAEFLRKN